MSLYLFYIFLSLSVIIILFNIFMSKRMTKVLRLSFIILSGICVFFSLKFQGPFFDSINFNKVLTILCDIAFLFLWVILSISSLKTKIKFGNYFVLSVSFILNIFKNNAKRNISDNSIGIGNIVPITCNDIPKCGHYLKLPTRITSSGTLMTGSSGSGKTYLIKELVGQDIDNGFPVVYFDFKGDIKVRREIISKAESKGYDVYCFNEDYGYFFDPLSSLSTEGRIEAIMSTRKWDITGADSHYRTNAKLLIQRYVSQFDKYLNSHIDDFGIMDMNEFPYTKNLYNFVDTHKPDLSNIDIKKAYDTFKTMLEIILTSGMRSTMMDPSLPNFSFEDRANYNNDKYILIISLPSENKELGNSITNLYLMNLISVGAKIKGFTKDVKLYLEEFGTLQDSYVVKDLFEKGRSMGVNTCISMQDIFQIVINTNEAYLDSLLGTITNYIIFAGTTKKAAERISGVQIKDIDKILLSLKRPNPEYGDRPTALFITKNSLLERGKSSEVYKIFPGNKIRFSEMFGETFDLEGDSSGPSKREIRRAKDRMFVDFMNYKDI